MKSDVATVAAARGAHAKASAGKIPSQDDLEAPCFPFRARDKHQSDAESSAAGKSAFAKKSAAVAKPKS